MITAVVLSRKAAWRICLVTLSDVCLLLFYAAAIALLYILVGEALAKAYLAVAGGSENLVLFLFLASFSPLVLAFLVFLWWVPLREWRVAHPFQEWRTDDPELEKKIKLRIYPGNSAFWTFTFFFFLPVVVNCLSLLLKSLGLNWWSGFLLELRFHSWWIALLLFVLLEKTVRDLLLVCRGYWGVKKSANK